MATIDWRQIYAQNAQMIEKQNEEASGGGGGGGGDMLGGGGGMGFDQGGETQTAGFKGYRAGERQDYRTMMGNGLMGSGKFTDAEIKRGYRRIKA